MHAAVVQRACRGRYTRSRGHTWLDADSRSSSRCSASPSSSRSPVSSRSISWSGASRPCRPTRRSRCALAATSPRWRPPTWSAYVRGARTPTVRSIVDNLRKAKVDRRVERGAARSPPVSPRPTGARWRKFATPSSTSGQSGKPVYAYLEYGGDRDYYLASAADKVFLMPSSPLDLTGVATYEVFLRGAFDKFGVYPDLHHIGDYKTAVQHLHREDVHGGAQGDGRVAQPRPLRPHRRGHRRAAGRRPRARSGALIDDGPFLPEQAVKAGSSTRCAYEDQVVEKLHAAAGGDRDARHRRRRLRAHQPHVARPQPRTAHRA